MLRFLLSIFPPVQTIQTMWSNVEIKHLSLQDSLNIWSSQVPVIITIIFRSRRSTGGADLGSVMGLVEALDRSNCAKQLVCQLHTKEEAQRTPEERLIISLFSKERRLASKTTVAEFDLAAKIGRSSRSEEECGNFYTSVGCPYTSRQMMTFFKSL